MVDVFSLRTLNDMPRRAPVRDWETLSSGDAVEVRSKGEHLCYARVDDVTDDGNVIWLIAGHSGVRFLHLRSDSVRLYRIG